MLDIDLDAGVVRGPEGELPVDRDDEAALKLLMLVEGECGGAGPAVAAKYGYGRSRYYQLLSEFREHGSSALVSHKRGPKTKSRRTPELERLVVRYRYLDPDMSADVIAQKLGQQGHAVSVRSVHRVIADYGLQKKTLS